MIQSRKAKRAKAKAPLPAFFMGGESKANKKRRTFSKLDVIEFMTTVIRFKGRITESQNLEIDIAPGGVA